MTRRHSSVDSSVARFFPESDKQWMQERLQAYVTSQVTLTGAERPISTYRLPTDESLSCEFFQYLPQLIVYPFPGLRHFRAEAVQQVRHLLFALEKFVGDHIL
jgi:hypothetical protein